MRPKLLPSPLPLLSAGQAARAAGGQRAGGSGGPARGLWHRLPGAARARRPEAGCGRGASLAPDRDGGLHDGSACSGSSLAAAAPPDGHLTAACNSRRTACSIPLAAAGQTILVLGAAGGVGLAAVQLARCMGARVIAVARGYDKMQALKEVRWTACLFLTAAAPAGAGPVCRSTTCRPGSANTTPETTPALQAGADECIDMAHHKPEQLRGLLRGAASQGGA